MNGNWKRRIRRDREGRPLTDADNLAFILESDPRLHGTVRRNEFSGMIEREKDLPFNPLVSVNIKMYDFANQNMYTSSPVPYAIS